MTAPDYAPTLTAWIDAEGNEDQLHVRVEGVDGTEYDRLDADLGMLLQQEQYVAQLSRPALTLLTLRDREVREQEGEAVDVESETVADRIAAEDD